MMYDFEQMYQTRCDLERLVRFVTHALPTHMPDGCGGEADRRLLVPILMKRIFDLTIDQ